MVRYAEAAAEIYKLQIVEFTCDGEYTLRTGQKQRYRFVHNQRADMLVYADKLQIITGKYTFHFRYIRFVYAEFGFVTASHYLFMVARAYARVKTDDNAPAGV
jgi:hypothetical protein